MKTLVLVAALALAGVAPLSAQAHRVHSDVFSFLARNVGTPEDGSYGAACLGIRTSDGLADPSDHVISAVARSVQKRDSIWIAHTDEGTWERDALRSPNFIVPASRCTGFTETRPDVAAGDESLQLAWVLIDREIYHPDGAFEIRALVGVDSAKAYVCSGWTSPTRWSVSCGPESTPAG